ncbi:MAG: hypothetical protein JKY49_08930 [Cohaesibacteraceae bacterium]|nr:hypothetical protein [Cohaesibacteraceae bacterium]
MDMPQFKHEQTVSYIIDCAVIFLLVQADALEKRVVLHLAGRMLSSM